MTRWLTSVGIACVLVGTALLLGPAFGFESSTVDRDVRVDVAESDATALLGLEERYDGTTIEYPSPFWTDGEESVPVLEVANNVDSNSTVRIDVSSIAWDGGYDDRVLEPVSAEVSLTPGSSQVVELRCTQRVEATATDATVGLAVDAESSTVAVSRAEVLVTGVAFDCAGDQRAGDRAPATDPVPVDDVAGLTTSEATANEVDSILGADDYSRVAFDIENAGSDAVTITHVSVISPESDATELENFYTDAEIAIEGDETGRVDADDAIGIDIPSIEDAPPYELDSPAPIEPGTTASVTLEQFREDGWYPQQVDMRGADVTMVLFVEGLDPERPDEVTEVLIELDGIDGA